MLLTMLADGRLHLSGIAKLLPILTRENRDGLLARATHRSKRQIVELVAELSPRPDVPSVMRKLPQKRPADAPGRPSGGALELGPDGAGGRSATDSAADRGAQALSNSVRTELSLRGSNAGPDPSGASQPRHPSRRRGAATTRGRGAAVARPLQGPVHRQRRAPRQARAARGPDAGRGARRRPGRDHRDEPSPRSSSGSRPGATRRRRLPARSSATPTPPQPRATSRPPSGVPCASGTATAAATSTSADDAAPSETGSSSTIDTRLAWAETTAQTTFGSCARATTGTWPRSTTDAPPSAGDQASRLRRHRRAAELPPVRRPGSLCGSSSEPRTRRSR